MSIPSRHDPDRTSAYVPATGIDDLPDVPGYEVTQELARGGMGRVLAARDLTLDREVAIKVLLPQLPAAEASRRFVRESKIAARLPHPGVPPVHQLGTLADGRPFLTMKLIRGRTLAELLKDRKHPADDLPRYVQVFEQICQAVGFAHSVGIIHRDLKPQNVMVGAFGEVQVMDWGLAKERPADGEPAEAVAYDDGAFITAGLPWSLPADQPTPWAGDETQHGDVLGTVSYMPPEQAKGELHRLGPWSDVFALGGILCHILTGRPPYSGFPVRTLLALAEAGDTTAALARLDDCGAEPELVALCKRCLAKESSRRPNTATEVAKQVAAYWTGVEERLRQAERDKAAAAAKAAEQKKKRRVQRALAVAVAALLVAGAAFGWWRERQLGERRLEQEQAAGRQRAAEEQAAGELRAAEERAAGKLQAQQAREDALKETQEKRTRDRVDDALKLAVQLRKDYRFREADTVLTQAGRLAAGGLTSDLEPVVVAARSDLGFVRALDEIRMSRALRVAEVGGQAGLDVSIAPREYQKAFLENKYDLANGDPQEIASRINASPIRAEMVAALDDWASFLPDTDEPLRNRLLDVARRADPGPWSDVLRDPAARRNSVALLWLAWRADVAKLNPATLATLAELMEQQGLDSRRLLFAAHHARPTDFLFAFDLAKRHMLKQSPDTLGYFLTARAIRPDSTAVLYLLGHALYKDNQYPEAIATLRQAIALDPKFVRAHVQLGIALTQSGDPKAALGHYREAVRLDPECVEGHLALGMAFADEGKLDEAVAEYRIALRLDPNSTLAHIALGDVLFHKGEIDSAIAEYEAVLERLEVPKSYPEVNIKSIAHFKRGVALEKKKRPAEAIESYREAVRLNPKYVAARYRLGLALSGTGDFAGSAQEFRAVVQLDPWNVEARVGLGLALDRQGDFDAAIAVYREALRIDPNHKLVRAALGLALAQKGDLDEAIAVLEETLRLDPTNSLAKDVLTIARHQKARRDAASSNAFGIPRSPAAALSTVEHGRTALVAAATNGD